MKIPFFSYKSLIGNKGGGFKPTPEQQEAIDSGITSEILSDIETDIVNLKENLSNFIGNFNTYAELIAYSGTLTNNDYAVVSNDETHSNECWRYIYNADTHSWLAQYKVNETPINTIDQSSNPTDTDSLSDLNGTTNKRWTFAKIWEWTKSKLVGAISTVLTDNLTADRAVITNANGKLAVAGAVTANTTNGWKTFAVDKYGRVNAYTAKSLDTNSFTDSSNTITLKDLITAQGTQAIYPTKMDAKGRVIAVGTGQAISDQYKSSANNQLLNRVGANAMWKNVTKLVGIFSRNSTQSITTNTMNNVTLTKIDTGSTDTSYCTLSSNGIKILKAGTYKFEITMRLTDNTGSSTQAEWNISCTGEDDNENGGGWFSGLHRYKETVPVRHYCNANDIIYPRVYIIGSGPTSSVSLCKVAVYCLKEI